MKNSSITMDITINNEYPREMILGPIYSIGRSSGNDLVLKDNRVSRNHAIIRLQADRMHYLIDLGSSNGTFLNGKRVILPAPVNPGDQIRIGNCSIKLNGPEITVIKKLDQGDESLTLAEYSFETVTILVVDIRQFTKLSETIPVDYLSKMVGKWFREAGSLIEKNNGSSYKFIGDAIMAYWIRNEENEDYYVTRPLKTAKELLSLAETCHQDFAQDFPDCEFKIGCGINKGKAALGNIGTIGHRDFTAVGDSVNIAFHIESLCGPLGYPILLSGEVQKDASKKFEFKDLGCHTLKGKSGPVRIYTVT